MNTIPVYPMSLNLLLYRIVLPFDKIDKSNILHFGYRQDAENIMRRRFNKPCEQVLYTSSYPTIAERETLEDDSKEFYLVKFRKAGDTILKMFVAIDDNCSNDVCSHARTAREAIKQHFSKEELKHIDELRQILEKDYDCCHEDEKYKESSELASKILESADYILTYSRADDGKERIPEGQESSRFLNVTFNKSAADEHLKIETIYYCKPKIDKVSLYYDILEIGIPNTESSKIEWYDWDVKIEDVQVINGLIIDANTLMSKLNTPKQSLMPNVCVDIYNTHVGVVNLRSIGKYKVYFEVQLQKKKLP